VVQEQNVRILIAYQITTSSLLVVVQEQNIVLAKKCPPFNCLSIRTKLELKKNQPVNETLYVFFPPQLILSRVLMIHSKLRDLKDDLTRIRHE